MNKLSVIIFSVLTAANFSFAQTEPSPSRGQMPRRQEQGARADRECLLSHESSCLSHVPILAVGSRGFNYRQKATARGVGPIGCPISSLDWVSSPLPLPARRGAACRAPDSGDVPVLHRRRPNRLSRL